MGDRRHSATKAQERKQQQQEELERNEEQVEEGNEEAEVGYYVVHNEEVGVTQKATSEDNVAI